jgi:hypothetical protein
MSKKTLMTRDQVTEKIVSAIKEHFTVGEKFDSDYDDPIFWSVIDQASDARMRIKLTDVLHKIEGFEHIEIDHCDSVNDIVNNNFKFKNNDKEN